MQIDSLGDLKRSHNCGELRADDKGKEAVLMGWVNNRRDLGNLIFIDLRDRGGITQIVFDPKVDEDAHKKAHILRNEWVLAVKGDVSLRLEGQENPNMPTGAIELHAKDLKILNKTEVPPFQVDGMVDGSETLRSKFRYLELRRPKIFGNFLKRHQIATCVREYLNSNDFIDVETPILTKSTPEGARDYLVPSRVNKGEFYALPQSPQLFKQLLMIAGFDRYYQIVKCFRDEDLRADRQPEFTQVDLEMSFADEEDVMAVFEGLMDDLFSKIMDKKIELPIPRMEYNEAMERFGTDRPDTRFNMELQDITDIVSQSEFKVFQVVAESGGKVKVIKVEGHASGFSRKILDELSKAVVEWGAKGLAWIKIKDTEWQSPIAKFIKKEKQEEINHRVSGNSGDLLLIVADAPGVVNHSLGMLRLEIARRLELIDKDDTAFVWVTKFPLFEYDENEDRFQAVHHPFTAPVEEDLHMLKDFPQSVKSRAYDLVLNGVEIGGGSVRIHNIDMQEQIFEILGISKEEADLKFGFFLEALKYGAPPHAGMAIGFDRLAAIMTGVDSIREVIAFPKTQSATCPLTNAPSKVDADQLHELALEVIKEDSSSS